jgi:ectoine hydroxylase-related dioxygenase (phytanoyl-CoA dioxygenase family)
MVTRSPTDQVKTHAVREFHRNDDEADFAAEEIRNVGYTLVPSGLSERELQLIRDKIDDVYDRQLREIGSEDALRRINDANVARCLLGYDEYFVTLAAHAQIMAVARRLLGENFILMSQNGIINRPADEHYQVTWHRDLNYQHFVSSRPLALSALYCVDDFSEETGGTYLLPASHKSEVFPSVDYVRRHQTVMSAAAGAILLFDAMIYHRSGLNRSSKVRRAVNHIYTLPLIKQQISLPLMLRGRFGDDPFLRRLLGYDSETGESVHHWRTKKLAQAVSPG